MTAPFDKRKTDYILVALSVVPMLVQYLIGGIGAIALVANWVAAGLFSWIIWNIIEVNRLGIYNRNHAVSISWPILSMVMNFAMINLREMETLPDRGIWLNIDIAQWINLIQMFGGLLIMVTVMQTWQNKLATLYFLFCGIVIGVLSAISNNVILWLLLFPGILYQMRSWSLQNWGSLISGVILSIWLCYVGQMLLLGVDTADAFILSYVKFYDTLLPGIFDYTLWEYIFMAFVALLLIIYSIAGIASSVAKSVKANAIVIMLAILSFLITLISVIDLSDLPNYIGMLAILLSIQITIHQSCVNDIRNEWWTISIIIIFAILSIVAQLLPLY